MQILRFAQDDRSKRAVLNRIPKIKKDPDRYWRQVFFICDEYHEFATAGQNDPNGDEKFLALSREPRCIPIVATQSISSLYDALPAETRRIVLQSFRTKIFLTLTNVFSAQTASELCGKEDQWKVNYDIQAILRHPNLSTTMNSYVKSVPQDAVAAMQAFETACGKYAPRQRRRKPQAQSEDQKCTSDAPQLKVG